MEGTELETMWTVSNFIKCAKAMKKSGPAYYFVLRVVSFLHSYICMHNVLQFNAFICGQSLIFMYSTNLSCKAYV